MKKMMFTLMAFLTIAVNASAMSYEQAREEALFLTDKMAYELNLTDAQYEAAYEINLDYLMGVTSQYDVYGPYWERRNLDLSYILFSWQWDLYRAAHYFYRPLFWERGIWHFGIYARYPHRDYFYFGRPHFYTTYRGGHSWRMNNGRSFYEGRRDFYRPGHITRDTHFGMRSGWDRGDYRPQPGGGRPSSTHVTGGDNRGSFGNGNRGSFGNGNRGGYDGNRGGYDNGNRGGYDNGNRGGNRGSFGNGGNRGSFGNGGGNPGGNRGGYDNGTRGGNSGSFGNGGNTGGTRGTFGNGGNTGGTRGSFGNGGGNTGGTRGSFGNGGGNTGGSRGSFGNGGGSGSFGGSRSSGSFSGSRSTGGSVGGGATRSGGSAGGNGGRGGFGGSRR
jgi:hypothetical protein